MAQAHAAAAAHCAHKHTVHMLSQSAPTTSTIKVDIFFILLFLSILFIHKAPVRQRKQTNLLLNALFE